MKKTITLLSLALCAQVHSQNQWVNISPPGISAYDVMDVYAKGDKIICVSDNPATNPVSAVSTSTDNGLTWQNLTAPFTNMFNKTIAFKDNDTGFVGGYRFIGGQFHSATFASVDGGISWGPTLTHTLEGIESITFTDDQNGYAGGYNSFLYTGAFFKTANGGKTWTAVYSNNTDPFEDVWLAKDGLKGYATDFYPSLYKTNDGGITWTKITNVPGSVTGFHFFNGDTGLITTVAGKIYKTLNGGTSWTTQYNPATAVGLADVEFLDDHFGFSVGDKGRVLESRDGGNTWTLTVPDATVSFRRIEFHDQKAFALGAQGRLWFYERSTVSLADHQNNETLKCYPNPVSRVLKLSVGNLEIKSINLYNTLGENVLAPALSQATSGIDVSSLPPALYFVRVQEAGGREHMARIIKE